MLCIEISIAVRNIYRVSVDRINHGRMSRGKTLVNRCDRDGHKLWKFKTAIVIIIIGYFVREFRTRKFVLAKPETARNGNLGATTAIPRIDVYE